MAESDTPEPAFNLDEAIAEIAKGVHRGEVVWLGALLDEALEHLLAGRMPNISNTFRERLFEGYGPLATFASKIDVSYALGFISAVEREDLLHIKSVRNEFSHATQRFDFHSPEITILLAKMRNYDSKNADSGGSRPPIPI